jgi:biopolymer transport protein ExbD
MSLLTRRRRRPEINIVPLMDVLTILIFFFLVSMQFRERVTLNLTLPDIETAGHNEFQGPIILGIDRDGNYFVNEQQATEEQLEGLIAAIADRSTDVTVLLKAHEETPLNKVTFAMDTCRKNGLNKIRLQSR